MDCLVALDMDGTLVDVPSSWAFVHRCFGESNDEGLRRFLADEIDDEEFVRSDVRRWWRHRPDLRLEEIARILDRVPLMPGARELFRWLHRQVGARTAIVSGGIDLLAERLGRELGIDEVWANGLATTPEGILTGEGIVRVPIRGKEGVLAALQAARGIPPERTIAVGNSAIDVGLFRRSRAGIAFAPEDEEVVRAAAVVVRDRDLRRLREPLAALWPDGPAAPPGGPERF